MEILENRAEAVQKRFTLPKGFGFLKSVLQYLFSVQIKRHHCCADFLFLAKFFAINPFIDISILEMANTDLRCCLCVINNADALLLDILCLTFRTS